MGEKEVTNFKLCQPGGQMLNDNYKISNDKYLIQNDNYKISNDKYQVCEKQVDFEAERKTMQGKMEAEVQELQTHLKYENLLVLFVVVVDEHIGG